METNRSTYGPTNVFSSQDNFLFSETWYFLSRLEICAMLRNELKREKLKIWINHLPNGFKICSSMVGSRKNNFYPIRINILGRNYYFVSFFGSKMRNFDAFLTGQPSYSTQIKFWLQLVLRIKIIIFEYPGGPSTMKK